MLWCLRLRGHGGEKQGGVCSGLKLRVGERGLRTTERSSHEGRPQSRGKVLWVWPLCHTCAHSHRYMRRHAHTYRWWASKKSFPNPDSSHVSVFKDPRARLRRGYRHNIQAIVIQEKFVHFLKFSQQRFWFPSYCGTSWGACTELQLFSKALYDSVVGEIWRECWGCSVAYSNSCCLLFCLLLCTSAHTQHPAKSPLRR